MTARDHLVNFINSLGTQNYRRLAEQKRTRGGRFSLGKIAGRRITAMLSLTG